MRRSFPKSRRVGAFVCPGLSPGSTSGFYRRRIVFELLDDIPALLPEESAVTTWLVRYRGAPVREPTLTTIGDAEARAERL